MQQRALGSSGLSISTIGLGTWAIGGWMWGGQDDADSIAAIHAAVDRGVNWIDTAPIYGSGHSEAMVGKALAALPASRRPLVFTKFGLGDSSDVNTRAASRANVIAECDASLRRLGVDRIDLYQLHWPAPEPIAETAAACDELVRAGKIRAIGVSNFSVAQLDEWRATGVPLHSLQTPYSILRPAPRTELLPWCVRHGVGVIAYSPLFRGLLFGTWTKDKTFPAGDARGAHKDYSGPRFQRHLQAVEELRAIGATSGLNPAQVSVGVLLHTPGTTGCIVGARNARQGAAIADLDVTVTDAQVDAVWQVISRLQHDLESL
ncbi:MAG TPA: aldo/keto reductase [Vicinamibacterales bacterium]|mgnify:FL=1|jgi:aryl-alcohol dehydrogenase-like predicted oxidoreductase|nr:aldo/keto reductase [Vicinamibacterales bacterium]